MTRRKPACSRPVIRVGCLRCAARRGPEEWLPRFRLRAEAIQNPAYRPTGAFIFPADFRADRARLSWSAGKKTGCGHGGPFVFSGPVRNAVLIASSMAGEGREKSKIFFALAFNDLTGSRR